MLGAVIPSFDPKPVVLNGRTVRLEPLQRSHAAGILAASRDPEIWRWMLVEQFKSLGEVEQWIEAANVAQAAGLEVAWATVRVSDARVVGSTRYLDIRRPNRGLEIGWTWIDPQFQRTAVNTEAKFLMLRHAFEDLGALRVQLKTDERNARSRAAIARLGAAFEGILRRYQARFDGYVRNTAMFSLTAEEWPAAKAKLEAMLAR
jgi:RimJ/RimL family protein N-acetyltransferase